MRRFAQSSAVLVIALFAVTPLAVADDWSVFSDPDGMFSADVPQQPVASAHDDPGRNGGTTHMETYMIDRGSYAMLITVNSFEGMQIDEANALDNAVAGTQSSGRTLVSKVDDESNGHPGRFVVLSDTHGDILSDRIFFVDRKLYQAITVVGPSGTDDDKAQTSRFSQSFHFLR